MFIIVWGIHFLYSQFYDGININKIVRNNSVNLTVSI